jgi:hypothetical protein
VLDEEDKQKQHHAELKAQMARWAGAMNSTFKALSVDLEGLGVYGGRVTADADLVMLMGVIESKVRETYSLTPSSSSSSSLSFSKFANFSLTFRSLPFILLSSHYSNLDFYSLFIFFIQAQRTLGSFNKFVAAGGLQRMTASSNGSLNSGGSRSQPGSPSFGSRGGGSAGASGHGNGLTQPPDLPMAPAGSPGNLSLPRIKAGAFGGGSPDDRGNDFCLLASDDEDEFSDDDDDGSWIKPMSSVDLKRSLQGSLSIGSVASPKGF